MTKAMKNRKKGSCIFLRKDKGRHAYECSIYEIRPVFCRLYPFEIKRIDIDSFFLRILPFCNGLNDAGGELVNKGFVAKHLLQNNHNQFNQFVKLIQCAHQDQSFFNCNQRAKRMACVQKKEEGSLH
jgi:Fe-S-cluster containining protein